MTASLAILMEFDIVNRGSIVGIWLFDANVLFRVIIDN